MVLTSSTKPKRERGPKALKKKEERKKKKRD
jgi:hypothetical protein